MAKSSAQSRKPKATPKLSKLIDKYYAALKDLAHQRVFAELGTRPAFHALLAEAGKSHGWTLIAEHEKQVGGGTGVSPVSRIRPDGTFKDHLNLVRGYWEAKDTADNLDAEIAKKRKAGYPTTNMIFEDTATAVLFQHGQEILRVDMHDPARLHWTHRTRLCTRGAAGKISSERVKWLDDVPYRFVELDVPHSGWLP